MKGKVLDKSFYLREDVVEVAKSLLGKILVTNFNNVLTSGIIFETEAYAGVKDKASHAYGGRRTKRTEVMYQEGGVAYIFLCYGIHSLFNVVTNKSGIPHAVLIRGIIPYQGLEEMKKRTNRKTMGIDNGNGPGKVSNLLGIDHTMTGSNLIAEGNINKPNIWLEEDNEFIVNDTEIVAKSRIGVDYAGKDAKLPYRYIIKNPGEITGVI